MDTTRRDFLGSLANSLLVFSLCRSSILYGAAPSSVSPVIVAWLNEVNDLAQSAKKEGVTQKQWSDQMNALYRRLELPEFLKLIDFETLAERMVLPALGEGFENFSFPQIDGLPAKLAFYRDIAGFRRGRSIPPHGHNHLVSSFLVLRGELHGRHFNRVRDEGESIYLEAAGDRNFTAGDFSTVTQTNSNVHWFTANTDGAFIFDIGIGGLKPSGTTVPLPTESPLKSGRIYLNPAAAVQTSDGLIRVPRIAEKDAYRLFG